MANDRLYNSKKIKAILAEKGLRVEALAVALGMCGTYAWTLVRHGKLPKRDRLAKEQRLVSFLGLASIDEILAKPKADEAA